MEGKLESNFMEIRNHKSFSILGIA